MIETNVTNVSQRSASLARTLIKMVIRKVSTLKGGNWNQNRAFQDKIV